MDDNSYNKTTKYTNVKIIFLRTIFCNSDKEKKYDFNVSAFVGFIV